MKLQYYADTDTLSIGLREASSVETSEIAPDVTVDYDADGNIISIDFDLASQKIDLSSLETPGLPLKIKGNLHKFVEIEVLEDTRRLTDDEVLKMKRRYTPRKRQD